MTEQPTSIGENLWLSLLRESAKEFQPDSSCFVLGNMSLSKRIIVDKICGRNDTLKDSIEIASYNYTEIEESLLESNYSNRVNIWSLDDRLSNPGISWITDKNAMEKV